MVRYFSVVSVNTKQLRTYLMALPTNRYMYIEHEIYLILGIYIRGAVRRRG